MNLRRCQEGLQRTRQGIAWFIIDRGQHQMYAMCRDRNGHVPVSLKVLIVPEQGEIIWRVGELHEKR